MQIQIDFILFKKYERQTAKSCLPFIAEMERFACISFPLEGDAEKK